MASCKDIVEIVTDYLEGRMGLVDRLRFQLHLGLCAHCRTYVRQMHATIAALGYLPSAMMTRTTKSSDPM